MRRLIFIIASLIVSAISLWLVLRDVPLDEVLTSIQQADGAWLLLSFGFVTLGLWTRAVRWRGLLGFRMPLQTAFHIINITFLANQLPFRAGEVARSLLATRSGIPVMTAATSIIVERLIDTFIVVILLAIGLIQLPDVQPEVTQTATIFGILATIAFIILLIFARYPQLAHRLLDFVHRVLPPLKRLPLTSLLDNVLEGLQPLTHWSAFAHAVGWSLIAWLFSLLSLYTLIQALQITDVNLWIATALGVSLASLSIAIPVSIAAIGPFEASIRLTGELVGMSDILSTSLGFLFHGVAVLSYAIWGTIGFLAMGLSLGDVLASENKNPSEDGHLQID